jgi:phage terminase large subunit GpA-like protein
VRVFHVNTDLFKSKVHRLAKLRPEEPGAWLLHQGVDLDYIRQVTAEHQVWKKVGSQRGARRELVWEPVTAGAPNHFLDAEVYCAALADLCRVPLLREHSPRMGVMEALGTTAGASGPSAVARLVRPSPLGTSTATATEATGRLKGGGWLR